MTRSSFSRHSPFLLKARETATRLIESIKGVYATRRILPTLADIARLGETAAYIEAAEPGLRELRVGSNEPDTSSASPSGRFRKERRGAFTILNLESSRADANLLGTDTTTYGLQNNTQ
jgi:hypothetical protein